MIAIPTLVGISVTLSAQLPPAQGPKEGLTAVLPMDGAAGEDQAASEENSTSEESSGADAGWLVGWLLSIDFP